jgi:hypothetical protein
MTRGKTKQPRNDTRIRKLLELHIREYIERYHPISVTSRLRSARHRPSQRYAANRMTSSDSSGREPAPSPTVGLCV